MKCQSNIPKYEEFKFLNECQIQFDLILESLKSARKLYLETEKLADEFFYELVDIDFTPTKKYLEAMCKWSNIYPAINLDELKNYITIYDNLCNKKLIKQADINSFKNYGEFYDFVNKNKDLTSKAEQKNLIKIQIL